MVFSDSYIWWMEYVSILWLLVLYDGPCVIGDTGVVKCNEGWCRGWFVSMVCCCCLGCLKCPSSVGDEGGGVTFIHVIELEGVVLLLCWVVVVFSC